MGATAVIAGVGTAVAAAGTIGSMASKKGGGGGASGTMAAASGMTEAQMNAARDVIERNQWQARSAVSDNLQVAKENIAPWRNMGVTALEQIRGLLALPGVEPIDATKTLEGTPGYQFLRDQGTEALRRYGAGTGLLTSGAAMKGALNYGQNLAQTYAWAPYMSSLQNLSGQGLQAGSTMGGWDMQAGLALGGYDMQAGLGTANVYMQGAGQQNQIAQQQAQLQLQQEYANNQQYNDLWTGLGYATNKIGGALGPAIDRWTGSGNTILPPSSGVDNSWWNSGVDYRPNGYGYKLMADGGPTDANRPYIIGERGPELFVPNVPGYIIPNEYIRYSAFNQPYRRAA